MEAKLSSETSYDFQQPTRHYISKDRNLHNNLSECLKSYMNMLLLDGIQSNSKFFPRRFFVESSVF
jgi:hypothetical protein